MECVWKIVVNHGSAIQIMFADLDLRRTPRCWGEYVEARLMVITMTRPTYGLQNYTPAAIICL